MGLHSRAKDSFTGEVRYRTESGRGRYNGLISLHESGFVEFDGKVLPPYKIIVVYPE